MNYALPAKDSTKNNVVKRASLAGGVGSFVEWYAYGIYGLLVSTLVLVFSANEMNTTDAG